MGTWIQGKWCQTLSSSYEQADLTADRQVTELLELIADIQITLDKNDTFIWWKDKHGFSAPNSYVVSSLSLESDMGINMDALMLTNIDKVWKSKIPCSIQGFFFVGDCFIIAFQVEVS